MMNFKGREKNKHKVDRTMNFIKRFYKRIIKSKCSISTTLRLYDCSNGKQFLSTNKGTDSLQGIYRTKLIEQY